MFSKVLSKLNLASSIEMDTRIKNTTLRQGDLVTGEVHLRTEQDVQVHCIKLQLCVSYKQDDYRAKLSYHVHTIEDGFILQKGNPIAIPFEFVLPPDSPVTSRYNSVFIRTKVESNKNGLFEKSDIDYLNVCPQETFQKILHKVEGKGFDLKEIEIEVDKYGKKPTITGRNFLQEFDFKPKRFSNNSRKMEEIEVALLDSDIEGNIVVLFSIEKYAQSFSEMFSHPEKKWITEVKGNQPDSYYEQIVETALNKFIY